MEREHPLLFNLIVWGAIIAMVGGIVACVISATMTVFFQ